MLRLLNRCVTRSGKRVCLSRNVQAAPSALCLKWERAEFNGVDVNLAQLGENNCSLDEFNARLRGK